MYKYTKIQGPRFQRNYIIARDQKTDGTWHMARHSIHRMLITRSINQYCSLVPKQSTLSSDRIRGPTRFTKALNLIFPKLSSQNMRGFNHATILSPSFHGLLKDAWHNDPPFVYLATLGARDFSSTVSGFCQVFIVTRAKSLWSRALLL